MFDGVLNTFLIYWHRLHGLYLTVFTFRTSSSLVINHTILKNNSFIPTLITFSYEQIIKKDNRVDK